MLEFDSNGYLQPYQAIETNIQTFERTFVTDFPDSASRKRLFENYLKFLQELKGTLGLDFLQWIDGSYVTKKREPNDMDIVTFLDHQVIEANEKELIPFRNLGYKKQQGLDIYFVPVYPTEHPLHSRGQFDKLEFYHLFTRNRKKQYKGFLAIDFSLESHE